MSIKTRDTIIKEAIDKIIDFAERLNVYDVSMRRWMNEKQLRHQIGYIIWHAISDDATHNLHNFPADENNNKGAQK